jgi:nitrate/nitrite-specific signal transduction histidine kinase
VKIRTRAYIALWLVTVLVAGTIGFILFAINIASEQDAERQRIAEILNVHGLLWRALVELKHDQHDQVVLDLPSIRERLQRERSAVSDYLAHEATLVRATDQKDRLQQLSQQFEKWSAQWDAADRSESPEAMLARSENDFAPIQKQLVEFDERERTIWADQNQLLLMRRSLFFTIVTALSILGMFAMAVVMFSAKKIILDPLTGLTESAHRIEMGDFTAAHQTLRADEIGVLINSFAEDGPGGPGAGARAGDGAQ